MCDEKKSPARLTLPIPIIVEGRYDKAKLAQVVDAQIITTEGFGIFRSHEKLALIRRLSENGIVILTDSDGAGGVIRSYLQGAVPADKIYNLYIPKIPGKERRKIAPSRDGSLGVEGMDERLLHNLLEPLCRQLAKGGSVRRGDITKADFFELGLTGTADCACLRDRAAELYGLPQGMTATALLGALNLICSREQLYADIRNLSLRSTDEGTV